MSYRRAWLLVESLQQSFRQPVTVASTGGKDGGGMRVTDFGEVLIKSYRELEQDFTTLAEQRLQPVKAAGCPTIQVRREAASERGTPSAGAAK